MLRAALYARFSTDMQSAASTADQLRVCREAAERMGAVVIDEFEDAGISGSSMGNRPGLQALLRMAKARKCDVVIAEHTDRLSRGLSGSGAIYEDLKSWSVRYFTVNQGDISAMHAGMAGVMSAMLLEEGAKKTRRGLEGVVLSGRSAGGMAYGYRSPLAYDASGERIRGLREVDDHEAATVRRIFSDYASGASPLALADALNREAIPAPRGDHWLASTIIGNKQRGTGILRNELYRGVRVWGRLTTLKDRESGKRRTALGTGSVQRVETPELRIIEERLWVSVQRRLDATSIGPNGEGNGQRRPLHLLSGLIRCGSCGGIMTSAGTGGYLRCSARTNRGSSFCTNTRNPAYPHIEARVLAGIEANLLHPLVVADAMATFHAKLKAERQALTQSRTPKLRELEDVKRRAARLVREVEDGMPWSAVESRHAELMARQVQLETELSTPGPAEVVRLHTGAADTYRAWVDDLRAKLPEKPEARTAVRALVQEVRFLPLEQKGRFDLDINADMAPIIWANESGSELVRAHATGSRFIRTHKFPVTFRLAG